MDSKFKVGDKVRRVKNSWVGMKPGDIGTIKRISWDHLYFKEFVGGHDIDYFELVETNNMNKKFKNKFAVTGSKHLLKAFAEELKEIGYFIKMHKPSGDTYSRLSIYDDGEILYSENAYRFIEYKLPQDYNKALELAKEVEEVIPEYVKCIKDACPITKGDVCKVSSKGIIQSDKYKFPDVWHDYTLDEIKNYFIPATKEEYVIQQIPEYVKCLEGYFDQYTKGKIYKNDLKKSSVNQYVTLEDDLGSQNGWNPDMFTPSTKEEYEAQFKLYFGDKEVKLKKSFGHIEVACYGEVGTLEQVQDIVDYVERLVKPLKFGNRDLLNVRSADNFINIPKYSSDYKDGEIEFKLGCTYGSLAQAKKILEAGNKLK
jgi:hypothetical protein